MDVAAPLPRTDHGDRALSGPPSDAPPEGLLIGDARGRVLYADQAAAELLGQLCEQLIGQDLNAPVRGATGVGGELIPDEDLPAAAAARNARPTTVVLTARRPAVAPLWVRMSATPLPPRDGAPDVPGRAAMIVTVTDVTAEILHSDDLRRSEALFRRTFEDAALGMATLSLDGHFLEVNRALIEILGMSRPELLARTVQQITHPDDANADDEQQARLLDGAISRYQADKRYVTMKGSVVRARVTVSIARDAAGRPLHVISQIEDTTALHRAQDVLERRALYDQLTGLANRSLLLDRLRHALAMHARNDKLVAVAFADLDHFKRINDSLGHDAGDRMLRIVADRMRTSVRPGDTVARIGGDEFVVVLEQVDSTEQAGELLRRILAAVELPLQLDGLLLLPSMSAGLALDEGSGDAEHVLRDADTALYVAKDSGRGRWVTFREEFRRDALDRLSVRGELRRALQNGDFELHYQPIVDLSSRAVVGHEALVRWRHPVRGLVLPEAFIAIAEAADLTPELGTWVLREAVGFLARHRDLPGRVWVNVSPRQIDRLTAAYRDGALDVRPGAGLGESVARTLEEFDVDATRLGIEIPESGVLEASQQVREELAGIARLGVALMLDDFGTGYSALSSLLSTPVVGLKLDRSFTVRLGDSGAADRVSIAAAALVSSIGCYGVAEGIETQAQRSTALEHGWTHGQGWLFGRPLPENVLFHTEAPLD